MTVSNNHLKLLLIAVNDYVSAEVCWLSVFTLAGSDVNKGAGAYNSQSSVGLHPDSSRSSSRGMYKYKPNEFIVCILQTQLYEYILLQINIVAGEYHQNCGGR